MVLPTPGMFGVPVFAKELARVAKGYGIEVDPGRREALVKDSKNDTKDTIAYDVMHLVPPQSAPDWVKQTPLADPDHPAGYVQLDKHTMQPARYPNVFALGDAGSTPNSKTGAAIRKQAPVVVENPRAVMAGKSPTGSYGGFVSCPLTTARNKMLLAEFDYAMEPKPSFPLIDTTKERKDMCVAAQEVWVPGPVLELHAQGSCLTSASRHQAGSDGREHPRAPTTPARSGATRPGAGSTLPWIRPRGLGRTTNAQAVSHQTHRVQQARRRTTT